MRAGIKYLYSPDINGDLREYNPLRNDNFSFLLQMIVGPKDAEGEESFELNVCTPQWLMTNLQNDSILFGRHRLIVLEFNYERIVRHLTKYVERW